ncbi:E3 ubiquitin-protein ligase TRIM45-like [Diadema setosum]|uniref:E3 ubiquitin-protein ligase TRIM45-like n=1 Tax=Diadema setosum TaxID=31175 RepID=UPI003B3B5B5F
MATVHQISSQNLECPICLTLFNQPKLLTCSHTFCKDCLQRISQTQSDKETITCPICRKETLTPGGDVDKLQTNVPLSSLVDEVKTKNPTCTVCEMDEKPASVSYCQDCGKYMCDSCEKGHSFWKPFSAHVVIAMSEVLSEKVQVNRRRRCKKHPNDDEECFCTGCREYVCCKCGMLRHSKAGHDIEEAAIHEEKLIKNINELKKGVKSKKMTIENHIKFIKTQRNEITSLFRKLDDDIDKTYEEYMQLLSARRESLKSQVKYLSEKFEKELQVMETESQQTISHMTAMEELVTNGMKVPLEKDALFAHDTLCDNLKSFLRRNDPDDRSPIGVTEQTRKIVFRRHERVNELCLGELKGYTWDVQGGDVSPPWDVKADVNLPSGTRMACIARAPGGKMAVGSSKGIHLYSPNGKLQQTVQKDVSVSRIGFLSDGRSVVSNMNNKVSLYTPQWEKLDVTFETMRNFEGGLGGLTVDRDDNIYVGYWELREILVFTPQGGKAVRSMMCDGYIPMQIFSFHNTGKLLLTDESTVVCLNSEGKKGKVLKKDGMAPFPAVCRDDSVIVAWLKNNEFLVSIDRYTSDLKHVRNVITDFQIQCPWLVMLPRYRVQEFESGEIAFCTPYRLYIFNAI